MPAGQREVLGVRSRGASKTWDEMVFDLWLAQLRDPYVLLPKIRAKLPWEAPLRGYWFSTSEDQLDQPKEYFDYIIDHSFLRFIIKKKTNTLVRFKHGGKLKLSILTKKKVRSGRGDFITFDEEAQAEEDLYKYAIGIISGSLFGFLSHISTPCKATIFEVNHDKLKTREYTTELTLVFIVPWWEAPFLARNKAFYEEEERTLPRWLYLQEYCAIFTLPMGSVFQNVVYGEYPEWLTEAIMDNPLLSGLDWNPVAGHMIVSIKWTDDLRNCVVQGEVDIGQGYAVEMTDNQFNTIGTLASHGNHMNYECSGINEEYVKWLNKKKATFNWDGQNWHSEEWDSQGINKLRIATYVIQNAVCIWVDKQRFPETAKQIGDCQWDPDSERPRLKKDKSSSPHYLDAFLHAASEENRRDTTFTFGEWR